MSDVDLWGGGRAETDAGKARLAGGLDELRLLVGLTYRELAQRTGCPRSTLHDALTGRRFPRLDTVLAIVRVCGGDVDTWRERWVAARRRAPRPSERGLEQLLDVYHAHPTRVPARLRRIAQEPGTTPTMSRQSTRPS